MKLDERRLRNCIYDCVGNILTGKQVVDAIVVAIRELHAQQYDDEGIGEDIGDNSKAVRKPVGMSVIVEPLAIPTVIVLCDDGSVFWSTSPNSEWQGGAPVPGTAADKRGI